MTEDDLDHVCRIEIESFSDPWTREMLTEDIRSKTTYCPVVRDESGSVLGYACCMMVADEAHLTNIAVSRESRGRGIGNFLVEHIVAVARDAGCEMMYLDVRSSNAAALGLYDKFGFVELYRRKSYYRNPIEDALVMALVLKEGEDNGVV